MRILVIEDEPKLADYLKKGLSEQSHVVDLARDGVDGLHLALEGVYDLIVLDVMLPGVDGFGVLAAVREQKDTPILMLTARDAVEDRVRGLEGGADDYLVKPFAFSELLARVQALLRRVQAGGQAAPEVYDDGYLRIDSANATVEVQGRPVVLTPLELRLLQVLVRHRDQILGRDQILDQVWGSDAASPGQVKLYIGYLRRKLAAVDDSGAMPIETVRGFGYRYRSPAGA